MFQFGINFARATIQVIATAISSAWDTVTNQWGDEDRNWEDIG